MPSAMSVNMFKLRFTTDCQPRTKNGHPPQSTTGVAKTSCAHATASCGTNRMGLMLGKNSPSIDQRRGVVSTTLIQKRRVMSLSSAFSPSSADGESGSSAMPQIGHGPGASRRISGCIGQVHAVPVSAGFCSGGGAGFRYCSGLAMNLSRQRGLQK